MATAPVVVALRSRILMAASRTTSTSTATRTTMMYVCVEPPLLESPELTACGLSVVVVRVVRIVVGNVGDMVGDMVVAWHISLLFVA